MRMRDLVTLTTKVPARVTGEVPPDEGIDSVLELAGEPQLVVEAA